MMFGVRIRAGLTDSGCCDIDYCAGADKLFQLELLATVILILEKFPEDISGAEVGRTMPSYITKPINLDPCWVKLQEMAKRP